MAQHLKEMENYYAKRADEYENIYKRPERQECIIKSKEFIKNCFKNKNVLEISCGTGYWTEIISESAKTITATDINNEVLEIAKSKNFKCNVNFIEDDSYILDNINEKYDSLFAGFWFSHIPKAMLKNFIEKINEKLITGSMIVFIDNKYVEGNNTPISRIDDDGNSYQIRKLEKGSEYEVLKNFYNKNELENIINNNGKISDFIDLEYFWILSYKKKLRVN